MQRMQAETEAIFKEECNRSKWMLYLRMLNARCCCWYASPEFLDRYMICNNSADTHSDGEDEDEDEGIFTMEP